MSEPALVEPGPVACFYTPLPAASESAAPLAAGGLRPDIALTLVLIPLTVILCCAWEVRPNLNVQPFAFVMTTLVLMSVLPTLFLFMAASLVGLRGDSPGLTWLSTVGFLRNCAVLTAMSWVYSHLKAGALLGTTYDVLLHDCDRLLLGGADPCVLCRALVPESWAGLLSAVYLLFLPVILGCLLWLTLTGRTGAADALTCSVVFGYYVGAFAYHMLPAYGPAYLKPEARPDSIAPSMVLLQQMLLDATQAVQHDPSNAVISPWRYIAAFPSLHFSHVLILTWYMRYSRVTVTLAAAFGFLTALSTIYFGWHYLVDLLGGAGLALLVLWATAPRKAGEATGEAGKRVSTGTRWRLRRHSCRGRQTCAAGEVEAARG